MFLIMRDVLSEAESNRRRGLWSAPPRARRCTRRGPRGSLLIGEPTAGLAAPSSVRGGTVGGARSTVAGGCHGNGDEDGSEIVGDTGGLAVTSTDRGDGSLTGSTSPAPWSLAPRDAVASLATPWPPAPAAFAPRDAAVAARRAGRCNRGGTSRRGGARAPGARPVRTEPEGFLPAS
jgi:hypothetical protein